METRKIGSLSVSTIGLGCNNFGGRLDAEKTAGVIDAAIDAGITLFDTADIYGGTKSEEYMGMALKGGKRDRIVLATKFGIKIDDERPGGGSPAYIRRAVEDSLRRLQTDRIDLYQIHRPDAETPIAETLEALNELVKAGKVVEIGCSNFSAAQIAEAEDVSRANGWARFVSVQNNYSLFQRTPETDGVLDACAERGIGFLPYFPLASGLLTGKFRLGQPFPEGTRLNGAKPSEQLSEQNLQKVEKLIAFSEARGHVILDLAFSWLLSRPQTSSVIAGATKPEQIAANVAAGGWKLTEADLAEVDKILAE